MRSYYLRAALLFFIYFFLIGCSENKEKELLTVSVGPNSFLGGYPAVWFSPSSGKIKEVGIEEDIDIKSGFETEWNCWIEPNEPEIKVFRHSNESMQGIAFLGTDKSLFDKVEFDSPDSFKHRLVGDEYFKEGATYLIKTSHGKSIIRIKQLDRKKHSLDFEWKKL